MSHLAARKPRLAIVTSIIGTPSEIWVERQAKGIKGFDIHLLGWTVHPERTPPSGLPEHIVGQEFPKPAGFFARLQRKLGLAGAYTLTRAQKLALKAKLDEINPDLVLVHFGWTAVVVSQVLARKIPYVVHVHGRDASAMMQIASYRTWFGRALKGASALVVVGQHQLDRLATLILPERVALIPCGAPMEEFAQYPAPDQSPVSTDTPLRFISIGRMSHEKGMMQTLEAFTRVVRNMPDVELVLIGYGDLLETLKERISTNGLKSKVYLMGRLSSEEIAQELSCAHVYLQHSREYAGWVEGFGVTLSEAGAAGLPLLASASGGLRDQIEEGENGFLFPPDDIEAQATLMLRLACDPTLRRAMGARARELAARFDSTHQIIRLNTLLDEVLDASLQK